MRKLFILALIVTTTIFSCSKDDNNQNIQIAFETPEIVMSQNEVKEIKITYTPRSIKTPIYKLTIGDETIARVRDYCVIEALKNGETTLTVEVEGTNISKTCNLIVRNIDVERIELNFEDLRILYGEYDLLIATVYPENATCKDIVWSSSDETLATVDENGKVMAVGQGEVDITATSKDGKVSAKCHVSTNIVSMTEIQFTNAVDKLMQYQEYRLEYIALPRDVTDASVNWTSSDETIATVNEEGVITTLLPGNVTITATSKTTPDIKNEMEINVLEETYGEIGVPMKYKTGMVVTIVEEITYKHEDHRNFYYFKVKFELPVDADVEYAERGRFTSFKADRGFFGSMSSYSADRIYRGQSVEESFTVEARENDPLIILQYSWHEYHSDYLHLDEDGLKWLLPKVD